jgi:peptidoglycan/LPS O-acetylase OafA/YrhL
VCHHLRPAPPGVGRFFDLGYLGVDLFGFLSGFVMAHHYAERLATRDVAVAGRYLWLRAVRIFPLVWLTLAAMVVARAVIPGFGSGADRDGYGAGDLVLQALLLNGWGFADRFAWNLPSWTVSSEWLCYLAFPLAAPWIARVRSGPAALALAAATLAATVTALAALGHADMNAALRWGWLRIAGEFVTGCFLQRAWASGAARGAPWGVIGPLAVAAAIGFGAQDVPIAMVACFAVLVYALAQQRGALARWLSARPLTFLGDASYAIYLVHWPVLRVLRYAAPGSVPLTNRPGSIGLVAFDLALVVAIAIAVHLAFDAPVRKRLRRLVAPP